MSEALQTADLSDAPSDASKTPERMTQRKNSGQAIRLSSLQRWILTAALEKLTPSAAMIEQERQKREQARVAMAMLTGRVAAPEPPETSEDVNIEGLERLYLAEIKARYYKFPVPWWVDENDGGDIGHAIARSGLGKFFDPHECRNYRAATTAISRAIVRLENRGLVSVLTGRYSHWTAITLTDAGKEIAGEEVSRRSAKAGTP